MKKLFMLLGILLFSMMLVACTPEEDPDDEDPIETEVDLALDAIWLGALEGETVYLTTTGQADIDIVEGILLASDVLETEYTKDNLLEASEVEDGAMVILVVGTSSKGLGAAGTDTTAENARAQAFALAAGQDKITLITVHVGGSGRRGSLSDTIIASGCTNTNLILVVAGGNTDNYFNTLAGATTPLHQYSTAAKVVMAFRTLFNNPAA